MIKVAITGVAGRMGKTLVQALQAADGMILGAAFEHPDNPAVGLDVGEVAGVGTLGVTVSGDPAGCVQDFDVVVDFTVPAATLALLEVCQNHQKAMVIGTTGFSDSQMSQLQEGAYASAIFMAPNMSVGVNLMFKLIEIAASALGDTVDVEVIEAHHRDKTDAPSGTALKIGEVLAQALSRDLDKDAIYGRQGITSTRDRASIGFSTLRGGDIVGEHTVLYAGEGERLEITHRASSRTNFAQGALHAVRYVSDKPPGLYDMQGLLGL